jgi:synaptobrevin homolog YKT6
VVVVEFAPCKPEHCLRTRREQLRDRDMAAAAPSVPHHVHAIVVVRQFADEDAAILGMAEDLTEFNYFTRGSVREAIRFAVRTIGARVAAGECELAWLCCQWQFPDTRVAAGISRVEYEGHLCQNFMYPTGMGVMVVTSRDYPARVALGLAQQLAEEFLKEYSSTWASLKEDSVSGWAPINKAIVDFQKPEEADKLLRVKAKLDDVKASLCSTIDQVLRRGEKLDTLMEKSKDLSDTSKKFYKKAKSMDSCCVVM